MKRKKRRSGYLAIPSGALAFAAALLIILTDHCFDGGPGTALCAACVCWLGFLALINL